MTENELHFTLYFTVLFNHCVHGLYMPTMTNFDPFVDSLPSEVPLAHAPLTRVIAQVRFPELLSIGQEGFVAPFQKDIEDIYPILRQEPISPAIQVGSQIIQAPRIAWRFYDESTHWRATLTSDFLALETTRYESRTDFLHRLEVLTNALITHMRPKLIDRLGIRYIDRLSGDAVQKISTLFRPEVSGVCGTDLNKYTRLTMTESLLELPQEQIITRWGYVPEGGTYDLAGVEPRPETTWVLDLDMFSSGPIGIDAETVRAKAQSYSERLYSIFRWAVTEEFLAYYGDHS